MDKPVNEPVLPAEAEDSEAPEAAETRAVPQTPPRPARRRWLRPLLLLAGPLAVIIGGAWWYYSGGRYVSTDNAYVQADMVAISPQVSGPIAEVAVRENQAVKAGDVLFRIERRPFEIAVEQAKANLASTAQDLNSLKATYKQQQDSLKLAEINLDYAQRKFDRQATLGKNNVVSQQTLDDTRNALDTARQQVVLDRQAMQTPLARLGGSADTPVEAIPQYLQAKAALDKAELDLQHTTVVAPFNGVASNMPQPGQYVAPGGAVMSLVSTDNLWIDANFKEIQLTYVKPGQEVDIWVDTYPDKVWHGTVRSVSPATGSEFSVIPAQNATGNWVKVVQRIPVRIAVDAADGGETLRAGMSTEVEIDTHHQRPLPGFVKTALSWFGQSSAQASTAEAPGR
jgi:membrane fusion protein (multidrug efflux system)